MQAVTIQLMPDFHKPDGPVDFAKGAAFSFNRNQDAVCLKQSQTGKSVINAAVAQDDDQFRDQSGCLDDLMQGFHLIVFEIVQIALRCQHAQILDPRGLRQMFQKYRIQVPALFFHDRPIQT